MRKISADFIFPIVGPPLADGVILVGADGSIIDVCEGAAFEKDTSVERYTGLLCPGFVNAHCHLELSGLKGKIKQHQGLNRFIQEVVKQEPLTAAATTEAMERAEQQMLDQGIVAVGDISNGPASFELKARGRLRYHTFIEVLGFHPDRAETAFENALKLFKNLSDCLPLGHGLSISPHAPYSASISLLKKIKAFAALHGSPLTMHNQENEEENLFYRKKEGPLLERFSAFGIDVTEWMPTGQNSLASVLPYLPQQLPLQLVHNTVSDAADIQVALEYNKQIYWCLCPKANLYIENRLPDFNLFTSAGGNITIGTDSLASNTMLSVLEELKTIALKMPSLALENLLKWATLNGAVFLGFQKDLGSLEKGKRPGINLIEHTNGMQFTPLSSVRRLV
jgi:cytosine/adenosine deaminase-related metal-dependent hydrolase